MNTKALLLATMLITSGCSTSIGHSFDMAQAQAIQPGEPMQQVIATIGQPVAYQNLADGGVAARWLYASGDVFGGHARRIDILFGPGPEHKMVRVLGSAVVS
jgi:hypothetical protein